MKVEIDLNEILTDEYGPTEDLAASIKRQVIENLTSKINKGLQVQIEEEISGQISASVTKAIAKKLPRLTDDLVDMEYVPVDNYGRKGEVTTLRNQLIKTLQDQMQYKPKSWDSEKNYFTKAIDDICKESLEQWKKEFHKKLDEVFTKQVFEYAQKAMQKKLGIQ